MFDEDELANEEERRYALKIEEILKDLTKTEENSEIGQIQQETLQDLNELKRMLESIQPLWQRQLDFITKTTQEILSSPANLKILSDIFKEEGEVLKIEEALLRKIDLKTGSILRKTTLKLRDLEKTKDMNLQYRNIEHIR